jgi:AraC family transcriptional regulator of adaptative response/methylated-DNA-[protein]-cysteine methyltransferase
LSKTSRAPLLQATFAAIDDPELRASLPLDCGGTPFQQRVWAELRRIPPGETRSYLEIARALGDPKATRAVGSANGANRLAVIIPCHRVVNARWQARRLCLGAGAQAGIARRRNKPAPSFVAAPVLTADLPFFAPPTTPGPAPRPQRSTPRK